MNEQQTHARLTEVVAQLHRRDLTDDQRVALTQEHRRLCGALFSEPDDWTKREMRLSEHRPQRQTERDLDDMFNRLHGRVPPKREPGLVVSEEERLDAAEREFTPEQLREIDVAFSLVQAGGNLALTDEERAVAEHRARKVQYREQIRDLDRNIKRQRARLDDLARGVSSAPSEADLDAMHAALHGRAPAEDVDHDVSTGEIEQFRTRFPDARGFELRRDARGLYVTNGVTRSESYPAVAHIPALVIDALVSGATTGLSEPPSNRLNLAEREYVGAARVVGSEIHFGAPWRP